jgi:hypothetical protein
MGHWEGQLADGRGIRIAQVRPPADFGSLVRGRVEQRGRFTFSGFLAPNGVRLLRISEDLKEPVWVQIAVTEANPWVQFTWDFGGMNATSSYTQRAG